MKVCDTEEDLRAIFFSVELNSPGLVSISVQTWVTTTWVKPVLSVLK